MPNRTGPFLSDAARFLGLARSKRGADGVQKNTAAIPPAGAISAVDQHGREAVERLIMQYRIERAAKRMGKVALVLLVLALLASIIGLFRPKYL